MRFKVIDITGEVHTLPQGDFSLVFHDTETLMQVWSSDGVIDEIPVTVIGVTGINETSI